MQKWKSYILNRPMLQHGFLNMAHASSSTEAEKRGKKTCAHFCYFTRILSRTQLLLSKVPDTMIWSYMYIYIYISYIYIYGNLHHISYIIVLKVIVPNSSTFPELNFRRSIGRACRTGRHTILGNSMAYPLWDSPKSSQGTWWVLYYTIYYIYIHYLNNIQCTIHFFSILYHILYLIHV